MLGRKWRLNSFPHRYSGGLDPVKAKARLNYGSLETPELVPADLIRAAEIGLVRPEEFRKNAVKFGWALWEKNPSTSTGKKQMS